MTDPNFTVISAPVRSENALRGPTGPVEQNRLKGVPMDTTRAHGPGFKSVTKGPFPARHPARQSGNGSPALCKKHWRRGQVRAYPSYHRLSCGYPRSLQQCQARRGKGSRQARLVPHPARKHEKGSDVCRTLFFVPSCYPKGAWNFFFQPLGKCLFLPVPEQNRPQQDCILSLLSGTFSAKLLFLTFLLRKNTPEI